MNATLVKAQEVQNFLKNEGFDTKIEKMDKNVYRVYTTIWHYDIACEVSENSDNYTLETFNMNYGEFGNLTTRKTLKAVLTYFNKFKEKAWNW